MDTDITLIPLRQETIARLLGLLSSKDETLDSLIIRLASPQCRATKRTVRARSPARTPWPVGGEYDVTVLGERFTVSSLAEVLVVALRELADLDSQFLPRLSHAHGRTRRYVGRRVEALYPGRPDLARYCRELKPGWFVGTNYSRRDVFRILRAACEVAGITFGEDLIVECLAERGAVRENCLHPSVSNVTRVAYINARENP